MKAQDYFDPETLSKLRIFLAHFPGAKILDFNTLDSKPKNNDCKKEG